MEVLDSFFGNVCELDLVFNFYKVRASGSERGRRGEKVVGVFEEREGCGEWGIGDGEGERERKEEC